MNEYIKELASIKSSNKEMREFGILIGGILIFLAVYMFFKKSEYYLYAAIPGIVLIACGWLVPKLLFWPQKLWMGAAITIGWVMGRVLLSILYLGLLTPISFILKLKKVKLLHLTPDPTEKSYWIIKQNAESDPRRSEKQF